MSGMLGTPKYDPKETDKQTCSRCRAEEKILMTLVRITD